MTSRGTNVALLVALVVAMGTGVGAFAIGTPAGRVVVIAHGVAGLAVVALAPWKRRIVRRGLRRHRRGRWAGITLLALVVVTVVAGVAHSAGIAVPGPVTAMQLHVGAAVAAIVPVVWHVVARPVRLRAADVDRRAVLRAGTLSIAAGGVWLATDRLYAALGATRRFTGSHERGSDDPDRMPVTQWLLDPVPVVDPQRWRLAIDDHHGRRHLALDDLRRLPPLQRRAVLDCTGGWYAQQTWTGVPLADLIDPADGRRVLVTSVTGYTRAFPVAALGAMLLALDVAGAPLSIGHGAPARLVVPGRRGYWWVKWVSAVRVDDRAPWLQSPFPVQ